MLRAFCLRGTGLLFSKASCLTKFMVRTFSTSSSCLFPDSKAPFVLLEEVCLQMFQQTKSLIGIAEGIHDAIAPYQHQADGQLVR